MTYAETERRDTLAVVVCNGSVMERKKRINPQGHYKCNTLDLANLMFSSDHNAIAEEVGVSVSQWRAWLYGDEPVPKVVYLYLQQKKALAELGPWRNYRVDGERLLSPMGTGMLEREFHELPEYRRCKRLAEQQAELIERLMRERDFYRDNCHRQARFGLMLNKLFR